MCLFALSTNATVCLWGEGFIHFASVIDFLSRAYARIYIVDFVISTFTLHFGWRLDGRVSGKMLRVGCGWKALGTELQYFSVSTRVLSRQYWSTLGAVLEYFYRSTGVFLLEYSSIPTGVFEYFYRSVLHIPCLEF